MDEPVQALRATAHPLRLQMLSLLTGAEMSAAEVARELGITHANASYHLRVLARAGEVEEAGEVRVRGGTAKRYRHPWRRGQSTEEPEDRQTRAIEVRAMTQELVRRWGSRRRGRAQLCDAELWVSDEVWAEALALVEQAAALVHEHAQPPRTEGTSKVALTIAAFGMES
ncbi:helix-turn-helix domain-containing protein [Nocardioides sp. zg-579]|uniref:Helix-turn-helix domain-containing protein n=1 Tax=Nocardioides marmotae TaxID=2663857 RepID=A0A6I3JFV6_9ACTN|nr:helix-turn-helix domain-containing protein [Nocardioides marmotae]MCR6033313.1 helix-turn-helix domain-containing protein [Gordonia jinghuaiqii]MTB96970.1 helix-turn-helix domain-containing protein [Nocardioides marmotae]QKE00649.1 helix-turn-helix transcriptional regulator [Nocardioides marmotae]